MPMISLSGKAQSGKDSFADVLVKEHGYTKVSFADELRNFCSRVFKLNVENFSKNELKDKEFDRKVILDFHHIDKMREILISD